jgi:SAM-dependent methyltransferase
LPPADLPPSWRDHRDDPVEVPDVPGPDAPAFYAPIGAFQGALYRRNAFAAHTVAEVDALAGRLRIERGQTVVDVGCGDGRHLRELAGRGVHGIGVDVSAELVDAARAAAADLDPGRGAGEVRFLVGDARDLAAVDGVPRGTADVVWSLCQGGFGTSSATDPAILHGLAACVRPGGWVVLTAFHALFAARHLIDGDAFDPVNLTHHQRAEVRGPDDARATFDLWTSAYTVRDLVRLADGAGLDVMDVVGCEPGRYDGSGVALNDPELLLVARRP